METKFLQKKISIVIPVFNNELNLFNTTDQVIELSKVFKNKGYNFECIFVDDGSGDNSYGILTELYNKNQSLGVLKIVKLTKNFGQYYATEVGIAEANGDYIGFISADLQEPIDLFVDMAEKLNEDVRLVIARREGREDSGFSKYISQFTHFLVKKYINES